MNLNEPITIADCISIISEYRNLPGESSQSQLSLNMERAATLASERLRVILVDARQYQSALDGYILEQEAKKTTKTK